MHTVGIVSDTSACVPEELVKRYDMQMVPIQLSIDGKTYADRVDITADEFYAALPHLKKLPSTAPSSPGTYVEAFKRATARFTSVVCITASKRFSAMIDSATAAANETRQARPETLVDVLDSGTAAGAQGLVVLAAARAADAGKTHVQVIDSVNRMKPRVHLLAVVDTLQYLARGGRVPQVAAWAASLFQIKPIVRLLPEGGRPVLVSRSRTKRRAVRTMVAFLKKMAGARPLQVIVQHSNVPDEAEELKTRILSEVNCREAYVVDFTPAMGIHTGSGLLAIAFTAEDGQYVSHATDAEGGRM
ncbi:MAG: DegV family protein [Chloroflexi bacterium]|nr:DegV family protein [Chloroflexota bacterium]